MNSINGLVSGFKEVKRDVAWYMNAKGFNPVAVDVVSGTAAAVAITVGVATVWAGCGGAEPDSYQSNLKEKENYESKCKRYVALLEKNPETLVGGVKLIPPGDSSSQTYVADYRQANQENKCVFKVYWLKGKGGPYESVEGEKGNFVLSLGYAVTRADNGFLSLPIDLNKPFVGRYETDENGNQVLKTFVAAP